MYFIVKKKGVFLISLWMNAKSLMKQHYLKKKNFIVINKWDININKYGTYCRRGYMYAKKVCKDFETKYIDDYQDLYLKSDTLLLDDADMCSET